MYLPVIIASLITIGMWVPYLTAATVARGLGSTLAGNPRLDTTPMMGTTLFMVGGAATMTIGVVAAVALGGGAS
jgi:hypothetical protein